MSADTISHVSHMFEVDPDIPMPDFDPGPPPDDYDKVLSMHGGFPSDWWLELESLWLRQWNHAQNAKIKRHEAWLGVAVDSPAAPDWLKAEAVIRDALFERRVSIGRALAWRKGEAWWAVRVCMEMTDGIE